MVESLLLSQLPKWKHAGQLADSSISVPAPKAIQDEDKVNPIAMIDNHAYKVFSARMKHTQKDIDARKALGLSDDEINEHFTVKYLIPHYRTDDPETSDIDVSRRDIGLLNSRVKKFFDFAQDGLGDFVTKESLDDSFARLRPAFKDFRFDTSFSQHTEDERALIIDAAIAVGHAVKRLESLGKIIIRGQREAVQIEYTEAYVDEHMADICKEFQELYTTLSATDFGNRLCECVSSHEGFKDRDGVFAHLIREIGKPVTGHIMRKKVKITNPDGTPRPQEEIDAEIKSIIERQSLSAESEARASLVRDIGHTMQAIDETYANMRIMMEHRLFTPYIRAIEDDMSRGDVDIRMARQIDLGNYRGYVREYVELSKARVGIRTEDSDDFEPLDHRLKFLHQEINLCHAAMQEYAVERLELCHTRLQDRKISRADKMHENERLGLIKSARLAIPLLDRGTMFVHEMTGLRLPRNHNASKDDSQQSTIERYGERVQELLSGKLAKANNSIIEY